MAMSISILIVFIGLISFMGLPVEQYPDIAPPTVMVTTTYTGASAEAAQKAVVVPLEEAINGVENMIYMTSSATNTGSVTIQVYFKQGTNPDMAAVNVQNRVSRAQALLPQEVTRVGVTTMKRQTSFLQINALRATSDEYDEQFIGNYLDINVVPRLKRIEGVGDIMMMGATYAMRIWLDPAKMAQYHLMPSDISAVLAEQNLESPTGSLGEDSDNTYQIAMKYTGRLSEITEFENMVISSKADGTLLRLKDVARLELGATSYTFHGSNDGKPAVAFMMYQIAGANATEINQRVDDEIAEMAKDLPKGLEFSSMLSSNDFLFESIANVEETLFIAIILVIIVVYFFLQDFRASIPPFISIIVSLIGTFACLSIAGFSINILTLFALVLAIGTVVDDAIVVVEAVQEKFDSGYKSSYLATKDAMHDVTMAVLTCTFVFMAVFIPVTFTGGTAGIFYTQFGYTMATSVGISCICALTLCPALCAMLMRPAKESEEVKRMGFFRKINHYTKIAYNATYVSLLGKYKAWLTKIISKRYLAWGSLAVACVLMVFLIKNTKSGLVPQEDTGTVMMGISCPPGSSLATTMSVLDSVETVLKETEEVLHYQRVAGFSFMGGQGPSQGMYIVRLKHWSERGGGDSHSTAVTQRLTKILGQIKSANILCFQPGMIPGYGAGNMIELKLQDRAGGSMDQFLEKAKEFEAAILKHPEVMMAQTAYARNYPQIQIEIDAAKCKRAGISPSTILSVLGTYTGAAYVSNFNQFGKIYRVMLQAETNCRLDKSALDRMYVRNGNEMAPISQFVTATDITGPENENRFNLFSCIQYSVMGMPGFASSEVMDVIDEEFRNVMPDNYTYEYGGISREERANAGSDTTFYIYAICAFLIFLILSCLYESFMVPWAVILSIPFGVMGCFLAAYIFSFMSQMAQASAQVPMINTVIYCVFGVIGLLGIVRLIMGKKISAFMLIMVAIVFGGYYLFGDLHLYEFSNNIYMQTGIIMLIGLLGKTAILITEFALERRRKGMGIVESAYTAAQVRLRPILMTVLTMIFGMIPLCLSSGAGANGNRSLGITIVGGMTIGTIALLFVVPTFFIFFEYLQEKIRPVKQEEADAQFAKELEHVGDYKNEVE